MKKLLSLFLALCLLTALCACASDKTVPEEPVPAEPAAEAAAAEESAAAEVPANAPAQPPEGDPGAGGNPPPEGDPGAGGNPPPEGDPGAGGNPPPDGSGGGAAPAPIQSAVRAEPVELDLPEGAVYLAFTGDVHAEIPGYEGWIMDIQDAYGEQFVMINYSGDICDKNWEEDTYTGFVSVLETLMPGAYNITTGNQEWKSGAPGAAWDELGEGHTRAGEVTVTEDYIVYNLGSAQETMGFPQSDIDALDAYLAQAPSDIPVFILGHFPLHLVCATATHSIPGGDHRQSENNAALIEVLNKYPNVVYFWGHNHSLQDPRYGTICPAGSSFTYDYSNPTEKIAINFTYINYGSFCRSDTYGVLAEVLRTDSGVQVSLNYVDTNVPLTTKDSAVVTFSADGVSAEVTPGTAVDTAEILAMSGYPDDPGFDTDLRG